MNKYTSADELLCLCIAQRELVSFSLTEVLLQKQHITPTILALIFRYQLFEPPTYISDLLQALDT